MATKKLSYKESWKELEEWLISERDWQKDCVERGRKNNESVIYLELRDAMRDKIEEVLEQMQRIRDRKLPWEK